MYEIRKDGGVIALTEKPNYIRRHADGFYILCEEEDAQGVAVDGTVYRLMGRTGLGRGTGNRRTARRCGWASPTRRRNGRSGASRWAAQIAYAKGAKVSHNGKHWTSDVDANVWEPGAYGWTEATA